MVEPANYTINLYQGATFDLLLTWKPDGENPADLTGYEAAMQARVRAEDADPLIDLSTDNDGIVLGGDEGTIQLLMSAEATAELDFTTAVYDLELSIGGNVYRIMEGKVELIPQVTR